MGYRSLEWIWLKEAMNIPIGQELLIEPSCFNLLVNSSLIYAFAFVSFYGIYSWAPFGADDDDCANNNIHPHHHII